MEKERERERIVCVCWMNRLGMLGWREGGRERGIGKRQREKKIWRER
jgi:hypothetical protein